MSGSLFVVQCPTRQGGGIYFLSDPRNRFVLNLFIQATDVGDGPIYISLPTGVWPKPATLLQPPTWARDEKSTPSPMAEASPCRVKLVLEWQLDQSADGSIGGDPDGGSQGTSLASRAVATTPKDVFPGGGVGAWLFQRSVGAFYLACGKVIELSEKWVFALLLSNVLSSLFFYPLKLKWLCVEVWSFVWNIIDLSGILQLNDQYSRFSIYHCEKREKKT